MSQTILDSIALGYQPVWNRRRQLAAVRLRVLTQHAEAVDGTHLLRLLSGGWPAAAPTLILAISSPVLLQQALTSDPVPNTWVEVPGALFDSTDGMAQLTLAVRRGHRLLRHTDLATVRGELAAPLDVCSLLRVSAQEVLETLRLRPATPGAVPAQRSPILPGQLYEGVCNRALAEHCLDEAGAWGILGWPDDDVLHAYRHQPLGCDASVIAQIRQAIGQDSSLDLIERLVRQDPVLVYRLLQLVNSAAYGLRHEIDSVRHALMMLGFTALNRWLADQLAGSTNDPALHPVRYAQVMYSRLAQHLLESGSTDNLRAEVYTTALFSQLDVLLQLPMADLLNRLPMSGRVMSALLRQEGPYHVFLDVARAQADVDHLHRLPEVCERHEMTLEHANRSLIRMLTTSRDQGP